MGVIKFDMIFFLRKGMNKILGFLNLAIGKHLLSNDQNSTLKKIFFSSFYDINMWPLFHLMQDLWLTSSNKEYLKRIISLLK